jgi:hypothetical protein
MEAVKTITNTNAVISAALHAEKGGGKESDAPSLFVQCKLSVGAADDPLEKEADDMADKVMRMPNPEPIKFSSSKNIVNRKCAECEKEEELHRKESNGNSISSAPSIVNDVLSSTGRFLDSDTRSYMEPRFNYDFSNVRIHDNDLAAKSASSINALAYTSGSNIVFNSGQYNTNSDSGKRLLAHELTHVVQQEGNMLRRKKLTAEEKAEDLQSERLKNDARLQKAFDQSPSMGWGETSEGVKTLQRALKDLGYDLTISFQKTGDADGIFQNETRAAVKQFQKDNLLESDDGVAGRETLKALDSKFITPPEPCHINYSAGAMDETGKTTFLTKNFTDADRPSASKILDDLCAVKNDQLNFSSEDELKTEIQKRLLIGKYMQESQLDGAFAYPEHAQQNNCPGAKGNALADAQVNLAARDYWIGPILETRSFIKNQHYYFELSALGKDDAYNALKLLFTPQSNICNRTLIHCDTLITLVNILVYAETIGVPVFNAKVKSGALGVWLTYDGLSAIENDTTPTAISSSLRNVTPSNEDDLVIGDHVVFWNHQAYDAITYMKPGPWRLENAILVKKAITGEDLFEGHGAPEVRGSVQPGTRKDVHTELMNAYNPFAKDATELANKTDGGDVGAGTRLSSEYPQVFKDGIDNKWYIKELDKNNTRPRQKYELREIIDPLDPEIIGLRNPYNTSQMSPVNRPVESL